MNIISIKSTENYLKEKIKSEEIYVANLTNRQDLEQGKEIIQSMKDCLNNENAEKLMIEWNELFNRANEIIKEANIIDLNFAKVFKL